MDWNKLKISSKTWQWFW